MFVPIRKSNNISVIAGTVCGIVGTRAFVVVATLLNDGLAECVVDRNELSEGESRGFVPRIVQRM